MLVISLLSDHLQTESSSCALVLNSSLTQKSPKELCKTACAHPDIGWFNWIWGAAWASGGFKSSPGDPHVQPGLTITALELLPHFCLLPLTMGSWEKGVILCLCSTSSSEVLYINNRLLAIEWIDFRKTESWNRAVAMAMDRWDSCQQRAIYFGLCNECIFYWINSRVWRSL